MHSGEIAGRGEPLVVRATGRRARRLERRAEQPVRPEVFELLARHMDGRKLQHRSPLNLIRNVAAELRAEGGWRLLWRPKESQDFRAWNWHHPARGRRLRTGLSTGRRHEPFPPAEIRV